VRKFAWQTSWGVSTRLIGALIMAHGDDSGLMMPPNVAPVQAVIVPIWRKEGDRERVFELAAQVRQQLQGKVRIELDEDDTQTPGWKFNEHEMRGVPLRIEIGPRDVESGSVMISRRLDRQKCSVPLAELDETLPRMLAQVQIDLLARARAFRDENTHEAADWKAFLALLPPRDSTGDAELPGFVWADWCGRTECEQEVQNETKATIRCIPLEGPEPRGACVRCGGAAVERVIFARAY